MGGGADGWVATQKQKQNKQKKSPRCARMPPKRYKNKKKKKKRKEHTHTHTLKLKKYGFGCAVRQETPQTPR